MLLLCPLELSYVRPGLPGVTLSSLGEWWSSLSWTSIGKNPQCWLSVVTRTPSLVVNEKKTGFVCSLCVCSEDSSGLPVTLYTHMGVDEPTCRQKGLARIPSWVRFKGLQPALSIGTATIGSSGSLSRTVSVTVAGGYICFLRGDASEQRRRTGENAYKIVESELL